MITVIADDITGAAELAGIAHGHGLDTELEVFASGCHDISASVATEVLVIATDTRSLSEPEAVQTMQRLTAMPFVRQQAELIFKKVDSALRGHVVAELRALMQATQKHQAVYLPANPSKGRIVREGIYYINEQPIAETAFSYDPEFPAVSSSLTERFPNAASMGIAMPDAVSAADVRAMVKEMGTDTILAGAADLFEALLDERKPSSPRRLILCGSTQSQPLRADVVTSPMPLSIYEGNCDLDAWLSDAKEKYSAGGSLALTIPHHHLTGKDVAVHLRQSMAAVAAVLVRWKKPKELIIEGGATAFTTLEKLEQSRFAIASQLAPGVVSMRTEDGMLVTLKPGSYPWK